MELEPLYVVPSANITITFATDQENGVLLYVGKSMNNVTFTLLCSTFRTGRYVLFYFLRLSFLREISTCVSTQEVPLSRIYM